MIKLSAFLIAITPFIASSQTTIKKRNVGELVIQGTLTNIKEPISYIYMVCLDGNNESGDSVRVINNKYSIRIQTGVTTLITLYAKNLESPDAFKTKNMVTLVTEPAEVRISSIDSFSNAKVTGSRAYIEYKKLETLRTPYSKSWSTLYMNYSKEAVDNNKAEMEQLQKRIDSVLLEMNNIYYKYIVEHPHSLISSFALNIYKDRLKPSSPDEDVARVELIYTKLSTSEKNSYFGKKIKKKLDSYKISIGMTAPSFTQNDTLGNPVSIAEFKGKYILLDFWASWCGPCRRENPNLVRIYNQYKDKGFTILSISLDRPGDKNKWMSAIRQDGLTWTNVSDLQFWDNAVAKLYKISEVPQNFLLDPFGKIIDIGLFGDALDQKLKKLLN